MISWCPECKQQYDHNQEYECPHKVKQSCMYIGRKIIIRLNSCDFGGLVFDVSGKLVRGNLWRKEYNSDVCKCTVRFANGSRVICRGFIRDLKFCTPSNDYVFNFVIQPNTLEYPST